jgi:hypothetical protein
VWRLSCASEHDLIWLGVSWRVITVSCDRASGYLMPVNGSDLQEPTGTHGLRRHSRELGANAGNLAAWPAQVPRPGSWVFLFCEIAFRM